MKDKSQNKNSTARKEATRRYRAKTLKSYSLEINRNTESEVIDHLEKQSNKQGYIKDLIKDDIKKTR